jgi:hypothetical protein
MPETQSSGLAKIVVDFDSGPLAGLLHTSAAIEVRK